MENVDCTSINSRKNKDAIWFLEFTGSSSIYMHKILLNEEIGPKKLKTN